MRLFIFNKKKPLILDETTRHKWAYQIAEHKDLTKKLAIFRKELRQQQTTVRSAAAALRKAKTDVPERAQHMTEQHATTIAELLEQTLDEFSFDSDVIAFQKHMDAALKALDYYKEHSTKNISALKEYYAEQLTTLANALQKLEDLLINTASSFDDRDYQTILNIHDLAQKLTEELTKKYKYERTLEKYAAEQDRNTDKQEKHRRRIEEQKVMVREKNALSALEKVKQLEHDDHDRKARYERLVFDTKHYILKNGMTLNETSKELFTALKKSPDTALKNQHEALKEEFTELADALSELEREDKKDVISRLKKAAKDVTNDAQKLVNNEKVLHDLKKQVMNDIAALNIYEQEQFLLRAKQEAAEHSEKLLVLNEALDEVQDVKLKQELHALTKQFGASIRHEQGAHL